jgi:hypothetical protein
MLAARPACRQAAASEDGNRSSLMQQTKGFQLTAGWPVVSFNGTARGQGPVPAGRQLNVHKREGSHGFLFVVSL